MQKIDTIIFDLGGVLINWDPKNLYRKIFKTEEEVDWFLQNICTMDWNEQQDAGRSWKEANQILCAAHPNYKIEIEAYFNRWIEMLDGAKNDVVDILFSLNQNYRLLALTNWSKETFPFALERFDFLKIFEGILVSGDEGIKKPSQEIFELMINRYKLAPSNCIFIDDSLRNIKGAQSVGLIGIHFQSSNKLKEDLISKGVQI